MRPALPTPNICLTRLPKGRFRNYGLSLSGLELAHSPF